MSFLFLKRNERSPTETMHYISVSFKINCKHIFQNNCNLIYKQHTYTLIVCKSFEWGVLKYENSIILVLNNNKCIINVCTLYTL